MGEGWWFQPSARKFLANCGRMRRADAILLERTTLHPIPPDEFAVEAYIRKDA